MYVSGKYRVISFMLSSPSVKYENDGYWLYTYMLCYKYDLNMFAPKLINITRSMLQFLVNSGGNQPLCFYFLLKHLMYCDEDLCTFS